MTLVGVLAHDRPEAFERCLAGLVNTGDARVLVHLDAPEPEVAFLTARYGFDALLNDGPPLGPAGSANQLLRARKPGEHLLRIDGDVELKTPGTIKRLAEGFREYGAVSPGRPDGVPWCRDMPPNTGLHPMGHAGTVGGVWLYRGDVLDALGFFRHERLLHNFEDSDLGARIHFAGYRSAYHTDVVAVEHGPKLRRPRMAEDTDESRAYWSWRQEHRARRNALARGELPLRLELPPLSRHEGERLLRARYP